VHQDELNLICETGMPPHVLELKAGAIVNLIKNLDVKAGLVNGTRLRVISINRDRLTVEIISNFPNLQERIVTLPRVRFIKEISHTLIMQRVQFPVRPAFAVTINKSQGLTLDKVIFEIKIIFCVCNVFLSSFLTYNLIFPGRCLPSSTCQRSWQTLCSHVQSQKARRPEVCDHRRPKQFSRQTQATWILVHQEQSNPAALGHVNAIGQADFPGAAGSATTSAFGSVGKNK
jgi:hypothetical protein